MRAVFFQNKYGIFPKVIIWGGKSKKVSLPYAVYYLKDLQKLEEIILL